MGTQIFHHAGIQNNGLPNPSTEALPTRLSGYSFCYAAIDYILATSFTSERTIEITENEERKREKGA